MTSRPVTPCQKRHCPAHRSRVHRSLARLSCLTRKELDPPDNRMPTVVWLHESACTCQKWRGILREPPLSGSFIATEVEALHAPGHCIAGVICEGSNHIPRLASIGSGSTPCCVPVLPRLTLWVQDSMTVEPALWELVCAKDSPHVYALALWEPDQKVIKSRCRLEAVVKGKKGRPTDCFFPSPYIAYIARFQRK